MHWPFSPVKDNERYDDDNDQNQQNKAEYDQNWNRENNVVNS